MKSLSHVLLLATPWTAAHRAPPSMGFSRQEYWSGVPLPPPSAVLSLTILIYLCLAVLGLHCCAWAFSSCGKQGLLVLVVEGFSLRCLLLWSIGSGCVGFSRCSMQTQYLWHVGLVAPWHMEYPQTRDQIHVPCSDGLILIHCATREIRV